MNYRLPVSKALEMMPWILFGKIGYAYWRSIEIEIINADEQVCSSPTCVKKLDPNPLKLSEKQKQQMLDEYLKDFYLLEAQLKKKGVL